MFDDERVVYGNYRCTRCGRNEHEASQIACANSPCPMELIESPRDTTKEPIIIKFVRAGLVALIILGIVSAVTLIGISVARAEYQYGTPSIEKHWHHEKHSKYHDVYKTWCQPGSPKPCPKSNSCCDAREETSGEDGKVTVEGHCYWTKAELRASKDPLIKYQVWWVLRDDDQWDEVPDNKIIREKNPDETGTSAHLCENAAHSILCFLPPTGAL